MTTYDDVRARSDLSLSEKLEMLRASRKPAAENPQGPSRTYPRLYRDYSTLHINGQPAARK